MRMVERIYIDGAFVTPHGTERFDLFDQARGEVIGQVRLGYKQSGIGREFGVFGLEGYLEPKAILDTAS